jgi:hypothetical protein
MLAAMAAWHVWGDYIHTRPYEIGNAQLIANGDDVARGTARRAGFDFERRVRNGFEPWTATFDGGDGADQEFAFASYPTVRGWQRV